MLETLIKVSTAIWLIGIPIMLWSGRAVQCSRNYWLGIAIFWLPILIVGVIDSAVVALRTTRK